MNRYRFLGILLAVMIIFFAWPHIALAQTDPPLTPDDTVSTVQLWMIVFGIATTAIASLMRLLPMQDLPDLTKKLIVVGISLVLATIGLAVQNQLIPETLLRATFTILITASGMYALLGKTIQDQMAGVRTVAVTDTALGRDAIKKMEVEGVVADPGH